MRRIGYLFEDVVSFENLLSAFNKAAKGTRSKERDKFFFNMENELIILQSELINGKYKPDKYYEFKIYDPKERTISVAPFKDRVVHHAVVNILEPIFEKTFIYDSYATRKNKGTHKAILRAQKFIKSNKWFLKTDIKKYFASINQIILMNLIERKIKDQKLLSLINQIISNGGENGIGLPIGNLTSQFFANVYLNSLDHFIKDKLGVKYYVRYMDDFVIFNNRKENLKLILIKINEFLQDSLHLLIKEKATFINKKENGLSFLGLRVFPGTIRIRRENLKRSLAKIKTRQRQFKQGLLDEDKLYDSVQSVIAHLSYYNTFNLMRSLKYGELS
jgi:RNA-directed DNA polymerase